MEQQGKSPPKFHFAIRHVGAHRFSLGVIFSAESVALCRLEEMLCLRDTQSVYASRGGDIFTQESTHYRVLKLGRALTGSSFVGIAQVL